MMKMFKCSALAFLLALGALPQAASSQTSDSGCEIVSVKKVEKTDENPYGIEAVAQDAEGFLQSIYDNDPEFIRAIEGQPIRGVLCTRADVIPVIRDFPILATGIPLSISTDFAAPDSQLVMVYYKAGAFHEEYSGPDLSPEDAGRLAEAIEVFNLQPNDLDKRVKVSK